MANEKVTAITAPVRDLSTASLWKGANYLKHGNQSEIDPAYSGHTFLFPTHGASFMIAAGGTHKTHMANIMNLIRNASTAFSGQNSKMVNFGEVVDGFANRKVQHPVSVTKECDQITIKLHEFQGLVLKSALEDWIDGILDEKVQRSHYWGQSTNLKYSIQNHSMGVLVVQTDPTWTIIQEAAWYYNMVPSEVQFDFFNFTKGQIDIVDDYDLVFRCNEERSPAVRAAAEAYMNAFILNELSTSFDRYKFDISMPAPTK